MQRDVGHLRAQFDQGDADRRGCDRGGDDCLHAEVGGANDIIDIAERCGVGGNDVNIDAQPVCMQPERTSSRPRRRRSCRAPDARGAPSGRCGRLRFATHQKLIDVRLLDPMAAKLDFDIGEIVEKPPAPKLAQTSSLW